MAAGRLDGSLCWRASEPRAAERRNVSMREHAMKVVLFCGGLGLRIRDGGENVPKPMVTIGYRPILWHVMKYYAHFGHKDFVLCLGHRGDAVKDYFLNYNECVSNDFTLSEGGKKLELMASDIHDWKITFVDTGLTSNIGQRLKAVEPYVRNEPVFLANYTDGLTNLPFPASARAFSPQRRDRQLHQRQAADQLPRRDLRSRAVGSRRSTTSAGRRFGSTAATSSSSARSSTTSRRATNWSASRSIGCSKEGRLTAYEYDDFWMAMDTFKDRQQLEEIYARGNAPWELWNSGSRGVAYAAVSV